MTSPSLTPEQIEALDAGREWMRHAWNEFNTIRARDGAPPGISVEWWDEVTKALGEMLGDDKLPWMTKAARLLVRPYEARAAEAESTITRLEGELARLAAPCQIEGCYFQALTTCADTLATENAALCQGVREAVEMLSDEKAFWGDAIERLKSLSSPPKGDEQ